MSLRERIVVPKMFSRPAVPRRAFHGRTLWLLFMPLAAVALWAGYLFWTNNFHPVIAGEAYRSGQMRSNELVRCIQRYGIRTVVNLRGEHPEEQWYREEFQAATSQNVLHRSVALSSRKAVSKQHWDELTAILWSAPKPVLMHCDGGADRVAFAAAVYKAEIAKRSADKGLHEFSIWYGYWPFLWKEKARLRESFEAHVLDAHLYGSLD
jgi:protein tyrosine phosphatase (PTP) superfamily phosphohydrolase (DUF442 family)